MPPDDLSSQGRALSALGQTCQTSSTASESSSYELPEEAKRLTGLIQQLQQQLQEKLQELIAIMADTNLSQEAKQLKLAEAQASISALTSNLMSADCEVGYIEDDVREPVSYFGKYEGKGEAFLIAEYLGV